MAPRADLPRTSGMNRRSFLTDAVRTGAVGVGLALGGTLGSAQRVRAAQGPIRIGFLSRAFPPAIPTVNDSPIARGFMLAVDELNARGGVLGRPIETRNSPIGGRPIRRSPPAPRGHRPQPAPTA